MQPYVCASMGPLNADLCLHASLQVYQWHWYCLFTGTSTGTAWQMIEQISWICSYV